ncbi:hypothetical protein [Mucilaginibacter flavidus]|uniref:hypothetical protein n=1 Tax=Mucilaginibacter flavidus TaxID=2949309 RepID=UPI0020938DB0|nr:hypothetical protein [Mucilaginibacter flavidus]MCO5946170.1 hypothetical protein [Mucilaginibacter flavidus]
MKLNYTRIILTAAAVVFFYTACKKSETKPDAKTLSAIDTSNTKIAFNLMQGLSGAYGGTNINDGIKAESNITNGQNNGAIVFKKVPLCGFAIDTTFNTKTKSADTNKTFFGNFKFVYTCSTDRPDGYRTHDSVVSVAVSPLLKNSFTAAQDYTVKALDTTYKLVSTNGSILSITDNAIYKDGFSVGYDYNYNSYTLHGLKIDFTKGSADIITGVAEFKSTTSYLHPGDKQVTEVSNTGTITFLGNHKARLHLNEKNKSYSVNLLTGGVTAI